MEFGLILKESAFSQRGICSILSLIFTFFDRAVSSLFTGSALLSEQALSFDKPLFSAI